MIPLWWSLLLTVVGVAGWWLVGRKKKSGFVLGISAQVLWIAYAIATQQWGFIASAFLYGTVQAQGLRKWINEDNNMRRFVKFTEDNQWEGETWHFWLQLDGNQAELDKLAVWLEKHSALSDEEDEFFLNMDHTRYEDEVDLLCEEAEHGYRKNHNKVVGRLNLGDLELVDNPDQIFYNGKIEDFFS